MVDSRFYSFDPEDPWGEKIAPNSRQVVESDQLKSPTNGIATVSTERNLVDVEAALEKVVERIHRVMQEVIAMPEVVARIHDFGALPRGSTPEEFRLRTEREINRFKTIVNSRRIPME